MAYKFRYNILAAFSICQVAPPDHPAGTTWVWDDGSGVVLKAEEKAQEEIEQRKAEQKEEVSDAFLFKSKELVW